MPMGGNRETLSMVATISRASWTTSISVSTVEANGCIQAGEAVSMTWRCDA